MSSTIFTPGPHTGGSPGTGSPKPKRRFFGNLMTAAAKIRDPASRESEVFSKSMGNANEVARTVYKSAKITVPVLVTATIIHHIVYKAPPLADKVAEAAITQWDKITKVAGNIWHDIFNAAKPYADFLYDHPIITSAVILGIVCVNAYKFRLDKDKRSKPYGKKFILSEGAREAIYDRVSKVMDVSRSFFQTIFNKWTRRVALALIPADFVVRIATQKLDFGDALGKTIVDVLKAISWASEALYNNPKLTALAVFSVYGFISFKKNQDWNQRKQARDEYDEALKNRNSATQKNRKFDPALLVTLDNVLNSSNHSLYQGQFYDTKRLAREADAMLCSYDGILCSGAELRRAPGMDSDTRANIKQILDSALSELRNGNTASANQIVGDVNFGLLVYGEILRADKTMRSAAGLDPAVKLQVQQTIEYALSAFDMGYYDIANDNADKAKAMLHAEGYI